MIEKGTTNHSTMILEAQESLLFRIQINIVAHTQMKKR
jgi:hypothetical protein